MRGDAMICKRCEQYIPWNSRKDKEYCRHCKQALNEPDGMARFILEENEANG